MVQYYSDIIHLNWLEHVLHTLAGRAPRCTLFYKVANGWRIVRGDHLVIREKHMKILTGKPIGSYICIWTTGLWQRDPLNWWLQTIGDMDQWHIQWYSSVVVQFTASLSAFYYSSSFFSLSQWCCEVVRCKWVWVHERYKMLVRLSKCLVWWPPPVRTHWLQHPLFGFIYFAHFRRFLFCHTQDASSYKFTKYIRPFEEYITPRHSFPPLSISSLSIWYTLYDDITQGWMYW